MAFAIDGNPPNLCIFSFIVFLFGLPLILGKCQALVLGETTLDVWSYCDKKLGHIIIKTQSTHILNGKYIFKITHWHEPMAT